MKSTFLIISTIFVTLSCRLCLAEGRFVTLIADNNQTNQLVLQDFETAKLKSAFDESARFSLRINKSGKEIRVYSTHLQGAPPYGGYPNFYVPQHEVVVTGPATLSLLTEYNGGACFATFEVLPQAFPPNQTVMLAPGTNQVAVTMETSTNLVQWSSATNGIYGSPETVRFFRIRMDKLN
jgi:hypothetical protein